MRLRAQLAAKTLGSYFLLFLCTMLILSGLSGGLASNAYGQEVVINRERAIKAAFLYQFSNYIKWPSSAFEGDGDPFVIGVFQTNPFGKKLDKIAASKKVAGRKIEIKLLASHEEMADCHIVFLPDAISESNVTDAIKAADGLTALLVGESSNFVEAGGDVQFFVEANKVRFAFHENVSERRGLTISSKLLSLSKPVPALSSEDSY